MQDYEKELYINQIIAGYTNIRTKEGTVKVVNPNADIRYEASLIFKEAYDQSQDLLDEEDIIDILRKYKLWTSDMEADYYQLPKDLENLKVELCSNIYNTKVRNSIINTEKKLNDILKIKHKWDLHTRLGHSNYIKNFYIFENTSFLNGQPYKNINLVISKWSNLQPGEKEIREIARSEPWNSLYDRVNLDISDINNRLLLYTKFYNSIREHNECPDDEIINDDYAIDGWVIKQKRAQTKNKKIQDIENKIGTKGKKHKEVYIIASSEKEIEDINNANDHRAKTIQEHRFKHENTQPHFYERMG